MTREEVKELLPVMQAFAEGKTIEYSNQDKQWFKQIILYGKIIVNIVLNLNQSINHLIQKKNVGMKCLNINHLDI